MTGCTPSNVLAPDGTPSKLYEKLLKKYGNNKVAYRITIAANKAATDGLIAAEFLNENQEPELSAAIAHAGEPDFIEVNAERLSTIEKVNGAATLKLIKRKEHFYEMQGERGFNPKEQTTRELAKLIEDLAVCSEAEKFVALLLYAKKDLGNIREFLTSTFDPKNKIHADIIAQVSDQLETYKDIIQPDLAKSNSALQGSIVAANGLYADVKALLQEKTTDYLVEHISEFGNKEGLTREEIINYINHGKDIGLAAMYLGDTSSSEDKMMAASDNMVKLKREAIKDTFLDFADKTKKAGEKLLKIQGKKDYSWMLHLDKAGKAVGSYVKRVGASYNTARNTAEAGLMDDEGKRKQFHQGLLSPEQRAENIALAEAKVTSRNFHKTERTDASGNLIDGEHHKLSDGFKFFRSEYQDYVMVAGEGKQWVRRDGLTDEAYEKFLRKYYKDEITYWAAEKDPATKKFTGNVVERRGRFPKPEYTEVIGFEDSKYTALKNDISALGKARLEFYNYFVDAYESDLLKIMPTDVRQKMIGSLASIRAGNLTELNTKGKGFLDAAGRALSNPLKALKNTLVPQVFTKGRQTDENGFLSHDLPIYFTGGFRNEERIAKLGAELASLDKSAPTYKKAKESIERRLMIEQNRIQGSEVETDLVETLLTFGEMAMGYQGMKEVESTLNLVKAAISRKGFYVLDNKGMPILDKGVPVLKDPGSSNTEKRFKAWLSQNYYGDDMASQGRIDEVVRRVLAYTSVTLQALNPFSAINNVVQANISQHVEAIGGTHYSRKNYRDANKIFISDIGVNVAEHVSHVFSKKQGYLDNPKTSKVDAMLKYFRVLQAGSEQQINKTKSVLDYGYIGIEAGEYQAQGTSAIAMMLNTPITGKDGTVSNLWDAHSLIKGELVLNPNFDLAAEDRHKITNKIKNVNRRIHGNYSTQDKVMLQKHWLGSLALQFRKWMYDGVRNRWGQPYYDEGIGVQLEGRYRSVGRMFAAMKAFGGEGNDFNSLSDMDKQNLRKSAAEAAYLMAALALYAIISALADGIPDDQDELLAAVNFLSKQASRTSGEMGTYINPLQVYSQFKNPIASLSLVKDAGVFIQNLTSVPFYMATGQEEELYYKTGAQKGNSKLWKSAKDLTPALRVGRQIDQLFISGDFFR